MKELINIFRHSPVSAAVVLFNLFIVIYGAFLGEFWWINFLGAFGVTLYTYYTSDYRAKAGA